MPYLLQQGIGRANTKLYAAMPYASYTFMSNAARIWRRRLELTVTRVAKLRTQE